MSYLHQLAAERQARMKRFDSAAVQELDAADLRRQLALLQQENRALRGKEVFVHSLPSDWAIRPTDARLLLLLANAPKGFASYETIGQVCRFTGKNARNTTAQHISQLRSQLKEFGLTIRTWPKQGYMLSRESIAKLKELSAA